MRFTRPGARKILGVEPNLAEKVAETDLTMSAWCEFAWRLAIAESMSSPRQKLMERYAARTRPNAEANEGSGQGTNDSQESREYAIVYTNLVGTKLIALPGALSCCNHSTLSRSQGPCCLRYFESSREAQDGSVWNNQTSFRSVCESVSPRLPAR